METVRICTKCKMEKLLTTEFFYNRFSHPKINTKKHFLRKCIECFRKDRKKHIINEREKFLNREYYSKYLEKNMWKRARDRAKRDKIEFNIEVVDITIPKYCPLLDIELKQTSNKAGDCSPSLDRINSELGYIKGNIRVISRMANIMKAHATIKQLTLFSKTILVYLDTYQAQYKSDKLLENHEDDNQQPIISLND